MKVILKNTFDQPAALLSPGAAFLGTVGSAGIIAGFGSSLALAKKKSPGWFSKVILACFFLCCLFTFGHLSGTFIQNENNERIQIILKSI